MPKRNMCRDAAQHYNLRPALIEDDYWLIRTLNWGASRCLLWGRG